MSPTLELDKPPSGPIRRRPSEESIRIHDTQIEDQTVALVRDADGNLAYPGPVPPNVQSPLPPSAPAEPAGPSTEPDPAPVPHKTRTEPLATDRPSIEGKRKFVTEAPRRTAHRVSTFPLLQRAGTNVSALNRRFSGNADDLSSSSSDSEDDEPRGVAAPAAAAKEDRRRSDDQYRRFRVGNDKYNTKGKVKRDGRLNITVNDTSNTGYLAKALGAAAKKVVPNARQSGEHAHDVSPSRLSTSSTAAEEIPNLPRLNIVIMVIGSRGDAQPFLKIGKVLKEEYGHRVRIATHPAFRDFVEKDSGLEFFSVGGDPSELMAFMVKNPGMIPKLETVKAGDIGRRRAAMAEMFDGFWRACINATDNEKDVRNLKMMGDRAPFVADAIIANPPSFAHIHCAEALGVPLHLMFTFPYTPTQAFPHPLASIKKSNVDPQYTNFISYPLVEMMVWQGLGDLVNDFRTNTLRLDPVSTLWAPGSTYRLHVPFTYLWSPGLVPKPADWGPEIDVSGFTFLDLASTFQPPQDLVEFLDGGETPIYIGFGSIVVDDADKFTEMIFEAVGKAGVRALVSKGWGGLGGENVPDNIFMLENTPHDWLFPRVRACVIHGGAGTTAIALKCAKPTMVVPFFGDQHFWGSVIGSAGAGPEAVPYKNLSADKLAEGIKYCLTEEARTAVKKIAASIEAEGDGAHNAVRSFHRHLTWNGERSMRCSLLPDHVAVWVIKNTSVKLSAVAADILVEKGLLSWRRMRLVRHKEWNDFEGPGEPVTGIAGALGGTIGNFFGGVGSVPSRIAKTSNKRTERKKRRESRRRQKQQSKQKAPAPKTPKPEGPKTPAVDGASGYPFPRANGIEAQDQQPGPPSHGAEAKGRQDVPEAATVDTQDKQPGAQPARPAVATQVTSNSILTATTPGDENAAEEYVHEASKGLEKSGKALAKAPVDLAMAIAQGFHNAPRLYGDSTVRRPPRVTGIKSGLRAAGSEFALGIYDGVTGIVRLPYQGAKEDGVRGAVAGVAMGLGGFVLKDISAIVSPFGYTLKGIAKQAERRHQPIMFVRRARIVQAQRELHRLTEEERKAVTAETYKGFDIFRQLGELIMHENSKSGLLGRLERRGGKHGKKGKQLGKWGKGSAFESVELAQKAIAAVKKGESVNIVLGKSRKSMDMRKSGDRRRLEEEKDVAHEVGAQADRKASQALGEDMETRTLPPKAQELDPETV